MKRPNMKNTPSALKWLAEKRARVAGEMQSASQVAERLREDVANARESLQIAERLLEAASQKEARAAAELASLDQVVVMYDQGVDPSLIEPINGWAGTYGKRGALRQFLIKTLEAISPNFVSTKELEYLTISHLSLVFEHPSLQLDWYKGSFRSTLKVLAAQGLIERKHCKEQRTWAVGYWRWKREQPKTLAELRGA